MKKTKRFRRVISCSMAMVMAASHVQIPTFVQTVQASTVERIKVNPQIHYQTLEGWGTSLCWWGNVIGATGERDFNKNGIADREEIAELAFSPEYLNLNIVRYNVGGGDKEDTTIKRVEGRVPGWSRDMFGNDGGTGDFLESEFYSKSAEEMNDAGQIWMLEQANKWRQDEGDIINEVFSNSPPYYMTKSGSSTGGYDWNRENLKDDYYNDFALYLARAAKWLDQNLKEKYGTGIDYIEPLNEPDTGYWINGSEKQEGCIFYPGENQIKIYQEMKNALNTVGLADVKMTGTDETSLDKAIWSFEHLDTQTRGDLDVISTHTYGGNDIQRTKLRGIAASYDKGLWMSEVTKGGGWHGEASHNSMEQCQTRWQSEGIMSDLKTMQPSAWIAWLVADSEYECIQTNENWGLIHYVFEEDGPVEGYHTNLFDGNGNKKDDVPDAGYWAVTKQFYTMMQYSKYLKAGYTMIEIGDKNMCAAISPDRKELVIVAQNFSGSNRDTSIDLYKFPNASSVELYRTSDTENCQKKEASLSDSVLRVALPSNSVSTYVITTDGAALYEESSYKTIVDCDVEFTEDTRVAGASDNNKFTYNGEWSDGWEWYTQEKYTTNPDSFATFKFSGVQASIYGKKSSNGAELLIQVDDKDPVPISAYASEEVRRSQFYTTPVLEDGEHTVIISMAKEQTAERPEIVLEYAEIMHGAIVESGSELTKEQLIENDYILYTVNCGTSDAFIIPNPNTEKMGLLQSNVDQLYGADEKTGRIWGCDLDNEYSKAMKGGIDSNDATDIGNTFIYMADDVTFDKDKSGLSYSFEVPQEKIEGIDGTTYEVTVAFKHKWDSRWVNISLEGKTVATDIELGYDNWVSKTFTTTVTDGVLNVKIQSPRRTSAKQDPILNYIQVKAVEDKKTEIKEYTSFTGVDGEQMYDTEGKRIQAHGGQIQQLTVDGETKWYWIGEDKTNDYRPVGGIHVYSSTDLYNWDDEGVVLQTMENMAEFESDSYFKELYSDDTYYTEEKKQEIFIDLDKNNCVMERPKMIYNEKYNQYVIWFHADGRTPDSDADYGKAKAGVAVSDSPTGPFRLLGSYKLNYHDDPDADHGYDGWNGRGSVRDMNLFVDDDKTGYVIYSSEGNKTTFISRLNDDYTELEVPREEAIEGEHFTRNFIGWSREAPAMFKYGEKYYIINSGCTGWDPNPAEYAVADHPMGPWTAMGDPCEGWESDTTFKTQSTCVIPVDAENGKYIYMGDRWNKNYLRDSRYVWLPIEFLDNDRLVLKRYSDWTLEELDNKGVAKIISEIPDIFESLEELKEALPDTIDVSIGGMEVLDAPVVWEDIDTEKPYLGKYQAMGRLTQEGRSISHTVEIVNKNMQYFFDCSAEDSDYLDVLIEVAHRLKNMESDQKYTKDNHAGYRGDEGVEFGRRSGYDLYSSGWWAEKDKAIEYLFDLSPGNYTIATGYQEWWNTSRKMKVSAIMAISDEKESILAEKEFTLGSSEKGMVQELEITVPETEENLSSVIIRIEKTGSPDAVLSFIGVAAENEQEITYSISGTVTEELEGTAVENVRLNLYKGNDTSLTNPVQVAKTDREGVYTFKNLESGIYSVELPASGESDAVVKEVLIDDADVEGIDFVYPEEREPSIKVVRKPDKLIYTVDDKLDLTGMEVRGRNIEKEKVVELSENDYEIAYDFSKPGTADVTVTYTIEHESVKSDTVVYQLSDTFEVFILEEEAITYVEKLQIVKKPYRMVYEMGEIFEPEGMLVEKTVKVVATASDAVYKEIVLLDNLDIEAEEFSKTGKCKVVVSCDTEGENQDEITLSDTLTVTIAKKSSNILVEGILDSVLKKLEDALSYDRYLKESERQTAFSQAVDSVIECLETQDAADNLSSKAFEKLKALDSKILESYPNITYTVQADSRFGKVYAEGLALSAELTSEKNQHMQLKLTNYDDKIPSHIADKMNKHIALESSLYVNEEEIHLLLPIRIQMDIPTDLEKENLVVYQLCDGEWKAVSPVISGDKMSFILSGTSLFVIANTKEPVRPSGNGSGSTSKSGNSNGGPGYTTPGTWKEDAVGWWYQKSDGTYVQSSWARINGLWYYFNDNGYMVTGWLLDDGKWYYLDDNGSMAVNTSTPDGYKVGSDGVFIP